MWDQSLISFRDKEDHGEVVCLLLGTRSYYLVSGFVITHIPYDQLPDPRK
jgi:hypothetical protein